jgi:hypothetical protein
MPNGYLDYAEHFAGSQANEAGGKTGSKRVKDKVDGANYQVKLSILDAAPVRQIKAGSLDRENFGEFIASCIGRAVTDSDRGTEFVPRVSLVYDKERHRCLVASRYLPDVEVGNLNDYAHKVKGAEIHDNQVFVSTRRQKNGYCYIGGDQDRLLRADLARAMAVSALVGDHDVNPGNMMMIKDDSGAVRVARIDFGHAFNDLLGASILFGGQVRNKENNILDYVNRQTVSHALAWRRTAKLWRHYEGIIPSIEMINAFREIADSPGLKAGLDNAKQSFESLVSDLLRDPEGNKAVLNHIKKSLITISDSISKHKIDPNLSIQEVLSQTFKNISDFCSKGQRQMREVADLMQLQMDIDKVIKDKRNGQDIEPALINKIKTQYDLLLQAEGIGLKKNRGIRWVKLYRDKPAFKGDLTDYILYRSKILGMGTKSRKALINVTFALPKKPTFLSKILVWMGIKKRTPTSIKPTQRQVITTKGKPIATSVLSLPLSQELAEALSLEAKRSTDARRAALVAASKKVNPAQGKRQQQTVKRAKGSALSE